MLPHLALPVLAECSSSGTRTGSSAEAEAEAAAGEWLRAGAGG